MFIYFVLDLLVYNIPAIVDAAWDGGERIVMSAILTLAAGMVIV